VIAGHPASAQSFLLQRAQPAMTGLIDGSLSTLAPIFTVALATRQAHYAFFAGLATAIGAGVSMAFSEGLSDTGEVTGRGNPFLRGSITGAGTFRSRSSSRAQAGDSCATTQATSCTGRKGLRASCCAHSLRCSLPRR
jgi:hypothetical protein